MNAPRILMALAMVGLVGGSAMAALVADEGHAPYFTNLDEAKAAAAEKNLPILVKFYTDW